MKVRRVNILKIISSSIQMSSQHSLIKVYEKNESMKAWGNKSSLMPSNLKSLSDNFFSKDNLSLSEEAKNFEHKKREALADLSKVGLDKLNSTSEANSSLDLSDNDKLKIKLIEDFISSLLNKKVVLKVPKELEMKELSVDMPIQTPNSQPVNVSQSVGWGFQYSMNESYSENEVLSFQSKGIIKTADGKEINFNVAINMSRSFYEENHISIQAGDAPIDPLVINFDRKVAEFENTTFSFDLDSNGKIDQISQLKSGSGLLALDLNNDGIINDGKELFGPQSGDGFKELSKYDSDNNNWIDENDAIFNKLRIWVKDDNGNDKLFALGEKGIGAIYLGNIDTQFSIKDTKNKNLAEVKATGVFVKENGQVGTIQHINYVI
jgi:hypothetical protein